MKLSTVTLTDETIIDRLRWLLVLIDALQDVVSHLWRSRSRNAATSSKLRTLDIASEIVCEVQQSLA